MAVSGNAVMLGPWGRTFTGTFWKFELPDFLAEHTVIKIGYGALINYIRVEPDESDLGVVDREARVPLCADEFIQEYTFGFSETDAKYLSWISLVNNKKKRYGPYGTPTNSNLSFTVTKGKPVGFFGWSELNEGPINSFGVELASSGVVKVGPWGPIKGTYWEHPLPDFNGQPTQIIISSKALIDEINMEPGDLSAGDRNESGCDTKKIPIGADELIKDYFVYVKPDSKCLSALTFYTNKEAKGTYGTVTTSVFPLPVTNGKLVGFFGYGDVPINAIGFEFVP